MVPREKPGRRNLPSIVKLIERTYTNFALLFYPLSGGEEADLRESFAAGSPRLAGHAASGQQRGELRIRMFMWYNK